MFPGELESIMSVRLGGRKSLSQEQKAVSPFKQEAERDWRLARLSGLCKPTPRDKLARPSKTS